MRAHEFITEAPLQSYDLIGDFSPTTKDKNFKPVDRKLVSHPAHIQKVGNFFQESPFNWRFYMVNRGTGGIKLKRETGETSTEEIKALFKGEEVSKILDGHRGAITVLFLGNFGDRRVMMTPWTMAHRVGHTMAASAIKTRRTHGSNQTHEWDTAEHILFDWANTTIRHVYGVSPDQMSNYYQMSYEADSYFRPYVPLYRALFQSIGTAKSSREGLLPRPYEFMYEMFAGYILRGTIKLNPLPLALPWSPNNKLAWGKHSRIARNKYTGNAEQLGLERNVEMFTERMEKAFAAVLRASVGKIYLM
jgi:hypothetical protein